ncbi:hypothetical protein F5Y19DRAFT_469410 [Xylariaceae sp. FL1651]|nr:hypothetical protein F5Y19DRAFT_469410 [Xylariaceae sp. FL1651]
MNALFLFGEPIGILSGAPPSHAEGFLDAFQAGFNGCGLRRALEPLNFLKPKGAWLKACDKVHYFANVYVDRAIETILRNQTMQAMIASTEITASLISHVIRNLASNPTICAHVRDEVLALGDAPLDFDQLPRIKSLHPAPIPCVSSEQSHFYETKSYPEEARMALLQVFTPAGILFDTCFSTLHRDPKI